MFKKTIAVRNDCEIQITATVKTMNTICFRIFTDNDGSAFTKTIFWGNEVSLQLFLLSFFSLVDLLATDYVLAALLTYLLNMVSV